MNKFLAICKALPADACFDAEELRASEAAVI